MSNESKRIPPVSEWQGLWIGTLVVSVFVVSLIDWVFARALSKDLATLTVNSSVVSLKIVSAS